MFGGKVHGLLKIRGEISKSDVVAGLLATKAVQEKVEEVLQVRRGDPWSVEFEWGESDGSIYGILYSLVMGEFYGKIIYGNFMGEFMGYPFENLIVIFHVATEKKRCCKRYTG